MKLNQIMNNLNKIEQKTLQAVAEGLEKGLINLSEESLTEAPLDKSPLRQSLQIHVNGQMIGKGTKNASVITTGRIQPNDKLESTIAYGTDSETAKYAVVQHEEVTFNHPTPGTKAKYLEDPFKRNNIEQSIEKKLRKVIK